MSSVKISKIEMVEAITEHLADEGKRMTNLKKASVVELEELVVKYGIDINAFVVERRKKMINQRIKNREEKDMSYFRKVEKERKDELQRIAGLVAEHLKKEEEDGKFALAK